MTFPDLNVKSSGLPDFEFITLTEKPASQKNDFSYTVRSRAMQSFLHQKKTAKSNQEKSSLPVRAITESKTADQLSGKFKLATWSRKPRRKAGKRLPKGTETKTVAAEIDTGFGFSEIIEDVLTQLTTPTFALSPYSNPLPISIENRRTKQLLYHYNTAFKVNSFAINFDNAWKPFSFTDAALLHAILCIVAQHQDLRRGTEDSSENLWHKGEVMRLINARLREPGRSVTGADIASVALLAVVESINGTYDASTAHRVGLKKMVDVHGGYGSFQCKPVILRVLAWADIGYSTRFGTPPTFPMIFPSSSPFTGSLAHTIPNQPSRLLPITIFSSLPMQYLLQTLRNINYAVDNPRLYISLPDRKAISDALHVTELQILASEHCVPSFCLSKDDNVRPDFGIEGPDNREQSGEQDENPDGEQDTTLLTRAFTVSILLYLQFAIRELPSSSLLHRRLLIQLLILLRSISWGDLTSPHSLDIMVWCVFVGCAVAKESKVRMELIMLIFQAEPEIEGMDLETVRERLKNVVWRPSVCDVALDVIWGRIKRTRGEI